MDFIHVLVAPTTRERSCDPCSPLSITLGTKISQEMQDKQNEVSDKYANILSKHRLIVAHSKAMNKRPLKWLVSERDTCSDVLMTMFGKPLYGISSQTTCTELFSSLLIKLKMLFNEFGVDDLAY